MILDQVFDALVIIDLADQGWNCVATVLAMSIILPQTFAWAFLKVSHMASWWALLRMLVFPLLGATILAYLWLADLGTMTPLRNGAIFCLAMSLETAVLLYEGLVKGKQTDEAIWSFFAEGLIEAPASAALTLYPALLMSVSMGESPDPVFVISFLFSIASITKISTQLHFYGMDPEWSEFPRVLLQKLPQVLSQVLGYVLFAFLTRPFPKKEHFEVEVQRSNSWLVFVALAHELAQNLGILRTASPRIPAAISVFFAATMVVGSPPGFLNALEAARFDHALQHITSQIFMGCIAWQVASEEHWAVLFEHYFPFLALYIVSVPSAFIVSTFMTVDTTPQERLEQAKKRLDLALHKKDRLITKLLIDVEQAPVEGMIEGGLRFVDLERKKKKVQDDSDMSMKWFGVAECDGCLYFCPCNAADIMILDPHKDKVSFKDPGKGYRGLEGGQKWMGVAECGGRLYFCPCNAADIMILDPAADNEVSFKETGCREGGQKWIGVAECGGRLYFCPHGAADIMILDPAADNEVVFMSTGKGDGNQKWCGVAECGGRLYFCPAAAEEIMVFRPAGPGSFNEISFIDTGQGLLSPRGISEGGMMKWSGVAECCGRLYFCPARSEYIMILDPGADPDLSFVNTGNHDNLLRWFGVARCGGSLYFCPFGVPEIMVLDPQENNELSFGDAGKTGWAGVAAHDGRLYFCPCEAEEIMVSMPSRRHHCHDLGALGE